ncbi:aldo/keto reductase [Glaciecola petra]|uniref:Aldo/keto reductase n=1 Tax=Glaciecola petra TaxID=3075602 RepID=A0ABU2ZV25_9ALTE|nr:aldo/keto reductase [Aestuariibacter sp. P117]MDT0596226.1 aldo/keto reductase [Aestuariibacter sp. P117]
MTNKTLAIHQYFPDASRLILGTMNLGAWDESPITTEDINQAFDLVTEAIDLGINVIDLADIYTYGKSEKIIGELFKRERSLRHHLILQSKVGIKLPPINTSTKITKQYDLSADWICESVNNSIKRLHNQNLDILFLHRPDPLLELEPMMQALSTLHEQGKFEYLAVSNMHAGQIAWLQSATSIPIIANQLEMSLEKAGFVEDGITTNMSENKQYGFPRGTLEFSQQAGIQLQAWGALSQGLFGRDEVATDKLAYSEEKLRAINTTRELIQTLSKEYEVENNAIVLAWLLRHPSGIQPVLGTSKSSRLKALSQATNIQLSKEHWYAIFEASRGQEVP